ncbi:Hypp31 [Branchiostoma lanceolatum]|uniref:Hypp31 protein n=1 Tax=Branchiostoma lanceolatum TaxID=7740 RepID=A0A8J9V5Q2_BRALA|nr:Hypp31 [Branchiostoma lanceolatum]
MLPWEKKRNGEGKNDNLLGVDSRKLCQANLQAASRSNITSMWDTLERKGVGPSALATKPRKRKVDKTDGGSRLKLPRKRKNGVTESEYGNGEEVSGVHLGQKRCRIVQLGADPQSRKHTRRVTDPLQTALDTKRCKQSKLKRSSSVSSLDWQGKEQEDTESHDYVGIGAAASPERRETHRETSAIESTANANVSTGDFRECSQSKSRRKRQRANKTVGQSRGRSVLCAPCKSKTRNRRRNTPKPSVTASKIHDVSRSTPQRREEQKASDKDCHTTNGDAFGTIGVTDNESQGWTVIRDALRSQTEWTDISLHAASADSNALRKSSKRKAEKHGNAVCSSKWERRHKPKKTDCLEPGTLLSPRLLLRPDSTYYDVVAGETVLVNHIDDDPCKWEAADEVELVACQDGNTPRGYRDASGRICRVYRQYLDIVNGEVLRRVASELWEYVNCM